MIRRFSKARDPHIKMIRNIFECSTCQVAVLYSLSIKDNQWDTSILQLKAIRMLIEERFHMQMFLDGYLRPRQSQQQELLPPQAPSFWKGFKIMQKIISFKVSSQLLFKLMYLPHQILQTCYNTVICTFIGLDFSMIRLLHNFDIRNTQNPLKSQISF